MSVDSIYAQVCEWLAAREEWIAAGGNARRKLVRQFTACVAEYGDGSPPACGCLLALVREAWGDRGLHAQVYDCDRWVVRLPPRPNTEGDVGAPSWWNVYGPTEGLALAAALLAAPPREVLP